MQKLNRFIMIVLIIGLSVINTKVLADNNWWQISSDEKGFIVQVSSNELEYRIHLSNSNNCDNVNNEISFEDGKYEWTKINASDNINSANLHTYNIPFKMDYLGNRCQVIVVKGMTGINNSGRYSHQYYAHVVNGTGETSTPSPTPTVTPTPSTTPKSTKKPTVNSNNKEPKKEEKDDKSDNSLYGIMIIGLLAVIIIIWLGFFRRKKTSINY